MSTSILYIDKKMEVKLSNAFSLDDVFDEPRDGEKFLDYIYGDQIEELEKDSLEYVLATLFGMPKLQWEILSKKLPGEIIKKDQKGETLSYRLHYIPHFNNGGLYLITVVIQDQSELVNDQKSLRYQSEDMKKFFSILSIQDSVFELFMDETSRIFKDLKRMVKMMNSQKISIILTLKIFYA